MSIDFWDSHSYDLIFSVLSWLPLCFVVWEENSVFFFFQIWCLQVFFFGPIIKPVCVLVCRYVLKKSFGRGSYGEVWLAFHWNCNQGSNAAKMSKDDNNRNSSSTTHDCQDGPSNYTLYILKRIMVIQFEWIKIASVGFNALGSL